jgi:hypothetical protein
MDHACEGIARRRTMTSLTDRRVFGEVAERSIAADCKSAAHVATEVRTLPSPPFDSALRASLMASQQAGRGGWCLERAVGCERVEGPLHRFCRRAARAVTV